MSLLIPQTFYKDTTSFDIKKWRATQIIKERRVDGEFYFAQIVRYYGNMEDSQDYDVGDTMREMAWIGRIEKFIGKRVRDLDHDSPTFGQRINTKAKTETIHETDRNGKQVTREALIEGKTIYEYTIPVTKENTLQIKQLAGAVSLNKETEFLFIYGAAPPHVVDPDTFWNTTVTDYLNNINPLNKKDGKKE